MRFLTLALAVLVGLSGSAQQSVPASTGTFVESRIPAAPLQGNLLGDPAEARVAVYLPPSYASSPQRRYPSVYLLHGYTGDVESFTRFFFPKVGFAKAIDDAIKRGASREMIVVVPSGRNRYFGSFYARAIRGVAGVSLLEFGTPEAMWHLDVEGFPAIVTMDAHGNSLHKDIEQESGRHLQAVGG